MMQSANFMHNLKLKLHEFPQVSMSSYEFFISNVPHALNKHHIEFLKLPIISSQLGELLCQLSMKVNRMSEIGNHKLLTQVY